MHPDGIVVRDLLHDVIEVEFPKGMMWSRTHKVVAKFFVFRRWLTKQQCRFRSDPFGELNSLIAVHVMIEVDASVDVEDGGSNRIPHFETGREFRPCSVKIGKVTAHQFVAVVVCPNLDVPFWIRLQNGLDHVESPALLKAAWVVVVSEGKVLVGPEIVKFTRELILYLTFHFQARQ